MMKSSFYFSEVYWIRTPNQGGPDPHRFLYHVCENYRSDLDQSFSVESLHLLLKNCRRSCLDSIHSTLFICGTNLSITLSNVLELEHQLKVNGSILFIPEISNTSSFEL
jgi:hypothetical protein